jgi:predicted nucleic-acid-binding protein
VSIAVDTNVLVRLLVQEDEAQARAALRVVEEAAAGDEPVLLLLGALLETEWVLRSRYRLDKASISGAFAQLLESSDVRFEHEPTVEEALRLWAQHPASDFADCLHIARAAHLGCGRFLTFDARAARLPRAEPVT